VVGDDDVGCGGIVKPLVPPAGAQHGAEVLLIRLGLAPLALRGGAGLLLAGDGPDTRGGAGLVRRGRRRGRSGLVCGRAPVRFELTLDGL
jgi:hypothetical protein